MKTHFNDRLGHLHLHVRQRALSRIMMWLTFGDGRMEKVASILSGNSYKYRKYQHVKKEKPMEEMHLP